MSAYRKLIESQKTDKLNQLYGNEPQVDNFCKSRHYGRICRGNRHTNPKDRERCNKCRRDLEALHEWEDRRNAHRYH